ncbi:hypothetical protein WJX77_010976 [Trebouxia sp. C0004]
MAKHGPSSWARKKKKEEEIFVQASIARRERTAIFSRFDARQVCKLVSQLPAFDRVAHGPELWVGTLKELLKPTGGPVPAAA